MGKKPRMRYWKGTKPISDTCWLVETMKGRTGFRKLGRIRVSGKLVGREMDAHRSIKGYEPVNIAREMAHQKFPNIDTLIVTQIACRKRRRHG